MHWRLLAFWIGFVPVCNAAVTLTSVVNAATYKSGIAPGSVATVLGSGLSLGTLVASSFPLPVYLGSAAVYINGVAAPLLYVSPTQINFQMPWETRLGQATLQLIVNDEVSNVQAFSVTLSAPGIFNGGILHSATSHAAGGPQGQAVHSGEYITILATGLGQVATPPATGSALADAALVPLVTPPTVTVGGMQAMVAFAGLAPPGPNPYTAGVFQVNALVPAGVPAGDASVVINARGVNSNAVNLSVSSGTAPSYAKFLVLGPNDSIVARAITSENVCPSITLDFAARAMNVRAAATLPFYPVLSCELAIPVTTAQVAMEGVSLAMPVSNPARITVLGDTGCRMDTSASQGCYDPQAWPVDQINSSALATNPQLLIHNGDYHYRENPCMGAAKCQGSPWGYNWDVWREDLFKPFQTLLSAAPWIFTRGNHESCDRAGEGWFRFLDPRPMPAICSVYTDPYVIQTGATTMISLDSAQADDAIEYPDQIAAYQAQFDLLRQMAGPDTWVLTHRPIWGIRSNLNANVVLQDASNNTIPANLILSGHTHTFQTYTFSPARAPQLVIGNSGDNLAVAPTIPVVGAVVGNATVTNSTAIGGFGFATITPAGAGAYTVQAKDAAGKTTATCTGQPLRIDCGVN